MLLPLMQLLVVALGMCLIAAVGLWPGEGA